MASYSVKQNVVENLSTDLSKKQDVGDYATNETLTNSLQSNLLNYTTNRILEIPQDIKVELNNGTLTLKAGSKVYIPNGFEADGTTPKFDVVVINSDLTDTVTANDHLTLTVYGDQLAPFLLSKCFSGKSAPTSPTTGTLWYDTVNNKMKVYANSVWNERNDCLPIAKLTANGTSYTSIDQIFNGFGYIGSTSFALPGVTYQFADGKNDDGTFKTVTKTSDKVTIRNNLIAETGEAILFLTNDFEDYAIWQNNYHVSTTQPNDQAGSVWFDGYQHYQQIGSSDNPNWAAKKLIPVYRYSVSAGVITKLTPYENNAINSYQRSDLAVMSMPSGKYIDLTLGAASTTYTAPANGWFTLAKRTDGASQVVEILNNTAGTMGFRADLDVANRWAITSCPAKAGDEIYVNYTAGGQTRVFRFIYAEGDQ